MQRKNLTSWIEINQSNLDHNLKIYRSWLPSKTKITAVVKANAYGHGLAQISKLCEKNELVSRFCVVNTKEALDLRKLGAKKEIFVAGYINSNLDDIIKNNLIISISDYETVIQLQKAAKKLNKIIEVHLKIDTGLSRLGINPQEANKFISKIKSYQNLKLTTIWSHFSTGTDPNIVHEQESVLNSIDNCDLEKHLPNSQGTKNIKGCYDHARIGGGLYGYILNPDQTMNQELRPVLSLNSRIIHIKEIDAGKTIGYKQEFKTKRKTTIAIIGIGYHDGVDSNLKKGGKVIINDQFAPIIGINMNFLIADITDIKGCEKNDIVILIGKSKTKSINGYDWQAILEKNVRELITNFKEHIPRIIV